MGLKYLCEADRGLENFCESDCKQLKNFCETDWIEILLRARRLGLKNFCDADRED